MSITFYDFAQLHSPQLLAEINLRFQEIFRESSFIEGKYNLLLEKKLSQMLKAKYCLLVGNCTDALEICLVAHDIKPGDYVGVPGITFHATAEAVLNVAAIPVLIDVCPHTGLIDPLSLERVAKKYPLKAIIPVHIYGFPAPIQALETICSSQNIKIIEDAAQAIGTSLPQYPVGGSQNLTAFSFYPTKNLGAFGDAGAILIQDEEMLQKISSIRNHGRSPQGLLTFGRNSRCDHLQAAILELKLDELAGQNKNRMKIASQYMAQLSDLPISFPGKTFIETSSWHLFPILLANKEEKLRLRDFLKSHDIQTMLFYEKALGDEISMQPYGGEKDQARVFADKVLCLPIHPFLSSEQINTVTSQIKLFFSQK